MAHQSATLRISLAEIAALTRVQRPVVSMWRSRSKGTPTPFPEPVQSDRGQQLFDAGEVADWLEATQRGNNPHAVEDMAAFARQDSSRTDPQASFNALTALIALRHLTGQPLAALDPERLLDAADEADPDDEFLYSEIEFLGVDALDTAAHADQLVDAAYSPASAFEQLLRGRFRTGLRDHADTALTDPALELSARTAVELSRQTTAGRPVFVDPTPGGSDLLIEVLNRLPEDADPLFITGHGRDRASRTALRRLLVHDARRERLEVTDSGQFTLTGPAVHVAAYPSPGAPDMAAPAILAAIENTVLQMGDAQRGVVLAPAAVLTDALTDPAVGKVRSDLLRSGRVRAIVRLPSGLVPAKSRQALALWLLGPSHASVPIAERWTLVADLSTVAFTDDVVQDLAGDLAVSMGSFAMIRAHAMRFASLVSTSRLLALRGALVEGDPGPSQTFDAAEIAVRADRLLTQLNNPVGATAPLHLGVAISNGTPDIAAVQSLMNKGHLRYVKGARLPDGLDLTDDGGALVLGLPELAHTDGSGRRGAPERRINRLALAAVHPNARLTEPGDVVFTTAPAPAAVVDAVGGAVVEYPARVLRINTTDPGRLMPELLAAHINAAVSKDWRQWSLALVPHDTAQQLRPVLALLEQEQAAARVRLERLTELTTLLRDGVSAGTLAVDANIELT